MYNRKRQRRKAAAGLVESLWNGTNAAKNIPATTINATNGSNKTGIPVKKSTAQPRPVLNIPPHGIGPIMDPNENDVLCGRGGRINSHAGNVQFRDIIHSKKKEYLAPSTKKLEKAHIAAAIVNDIRTKDPPGRFLKEEKGTGLWFDIGDAKAIKKTGQALREDAPDIRPGIEAAGSSGDEKKLGGVPPTSRNKPEVVKSKSLSPPRTSQIRRKESSAVQQQNDVQPVWPQQQENNSLLAALSDPLSQLSKSPPFLPQLANYKFNANINIYSMQQPFSQQQQQHRGFETRNIPLQVPSQAGVTSKPFSNQSCSGAQPATRKTMQSSSGSAVGQQYAPFGYGRHGIGATVSVPTREPNLEDVAFGRAFYDPEGHNISSHHGGDDHTVSTISGLSEPISGIGSGLIGNASNLMNCSMKSNLSINDSLRLHNLKESVGSTKQSYDPMVMSNFGLNGSIKSGLSGSLTRSTSFPDMSSVVEGENWKSIMEADDSLLDEAALKPAWSIRIGARNNSAVSIGSLMDVQSSASSTKWLEAAGLGLNYPTMLDDKSITEKSQTSSAMMSTDLVDALDLASSERLNH